MNVYIYAVHHPTCPSTAYWSISQSYLNMCFDNKRQFIYNLNIAQTVGFHKGATVCCGHSCHFPANLGPLWNSDCKIELKLD